MRNYAVENTTKIDADLTRFVELFALIGANEKLFPKYCRTCGKEYGSFRDYVLRTVAKAHCLEDCSEVMGAPFTMMYRHCRCGNTLVLSITEEIIPSLNEFWEAVVQQAEQSGRSPKSIVLDFALRCERDFAASDNGKNIP